MQCLDRSGNFGLVSVSTPPPRHKNSNAFVPPKGITTILIILLQILFLKLFGWAPVSYTGSSGIMLVNKNLGWIALYTAKLLRGSSAQ